MDPSAHASIPQSEYVDPVSVDGSDSRVAAASCGQWEVQIKSRF